MRSKDLPPGSGPRHLVVCPKREMLFVVNELEPTVCAFKIKDDGSIELEQTANAYLPEELKGKPLDWEGCPSFRPLNHGAEIALHPTGKWLYVSHRNVGSIIQFNVDANGRLAKEEVVTTKSLNPRHFTIDPEGKMVYVVCMNKDLLEVYDINQTNGKLVLNSVTTSPNSPSFVGFI